ncbi:haloacid dehalogenase, type II [Cyphellophora europaea CBS 101466]|uniref:Haloacid dehalogenase, type II n=1 Tax=Cyphellophora europaea (strain CBS 101466) TaxID=1220924 RepID=W2S363_CYPE1|nr:haloacid dehalogenase, type II [Cyphellophora europaea CBS 101466]ETN42473.1 haloacid dehalogenase, type II [Cyphellophora europaea CBS 101466]
MVIAAPPDLAGVKAIFFDYMGTCLDWHSSVVAALPQDIAINTRSSLAIALREAFFADIHTRFEQRLPPEDIDATHARLLGVLLQSKQFEYISVNAEERNKVIEAWHHMSAWPDVPPALDKLRERYELFVLANGTTRLQLDLTRSSGLPFDMLLSSQLLGVTKPDPDMYRKALQLVGVLPEESVMVAAHAYDLRAAKKVGMRTIYVRRWTEDTLENMEAVKQDVDWFLSGTGEVGSTDGSFISLVELPS